MVCFCVLCCCSASVCALCKPIEKHLKNMDRFGRQDPYCKFSIGNQKRKGKTVQKGGSNPYFNEEEFEFWIDSKSWNKDMLFECWDEDVGADDFIGSCKFGILEFSKLKPNTRVKRWLHLMDKKNKEENNNLQNRIKNFKTA